jgi:hypothetical protein
MVDPMSDLSEQAGALSDAWQESYSELLTVVYRMARRIEQLEVQLARRPV